MTRFRVILLLFVLALIGSLATQRGIYWSLTGALLALLLFSVIIAFAGVAQLKARRRVATRVGQVGQMLDEEIALQNTGPLPKLWLEVADEGNLPNHHAGRVLSWMQGKKWRGWKVQTLATERGRFTLGPLRVTSGDPLGVFQRSKLLPATQNILIYPASYALPNFPIKSTVTPGGDALRKRTPNVTTNAAGVRDYVVGDSLNRIHWRISARRQKLTVKEFELDPTSDYWIMLDLERGAHASLGIGVDSFVDSSVYMLPPNSEEYAVSVAASVGRHFINQGKNVGLAAYAGHREVLQPDRGDRQLNKMLEMLAVIRAAGSVPFARVLRAEGQLLSRGSTLVAISASPEVAWVASLAQIARNGTRVIAIVLDLATFGDSVGVEDVRTALAEAGVDHRVVQRGDDFGRVLA